MKEQRCTIRVCYRPKGWISRSLTLVAIASRSSLGQTKQIKAPLQWISNQVMGLWKKQRDFIYQAAQCLTSASARSKVFGCIILPRMRGLVQSSFRMIKGQATWPCNVRIALVQEAPQRSQLLEIRALRLMSQLSASMAGSVY